MSRAQALGISYTGKARAYMALLHLPPIGMVVLATAGSTFIAGGDSAPLDRMGWLLAGVLLTQVSISLHNDYCDRELDAVTKPWRALPQGLVSPGGALGAAAVLGLMGVAAAARAGGEAAVLLLGGTACGYLYNARLKGTLWAWVPHWLALPTIPLMGFAVGGGEGPAIWTVYAIGGPLVLAVYLADTMEDIAADTGAGVRGLAQLLGDQAAYLLSASAFGMAACLAAALWPAETGPNPLFHSAMALYGVAAVAHGRPRLHWAGTMGAAVALTLGWLAAFAA